MHGQKNVEKIHYFGLYILVQMNLKDVIEWRVDLLNCLAKPHITLSYVKLSLPLTYSLPAI